MERFTLTPADNLMWTVKDRKTGFSIKFREGLFNETQKVNTPDSLNQEQVEHAHTTMREIGDWMAQNHPEVCICNPLSRYYAICSLANEKYWLALADAMKSLIVDWSDDDAADFLLDEMEDYLRLDNSIGLTEAESSMLRGSLSFFESAEAMEVINLVHVFWGYKSDTSIENWVRDLLWWPAFCPKELIDNTNPND